MKKRVAIYLRVSKSKQDTENQLRELSAVAVRMGATSVSGQKLTSRQ
jgi:DNA invertase Pin-like site-specific DNA recombinase